MRAITIILYLIGCVLIGAIGDGLNESGVTVVGWLFEALEIPVLISGAFLFRLVRRDWIAFLVAYIAFRVLLFDYAYNLAAGYELLHLGTSKLWDSFFSKYPPHGLIFTRVIFGILGVGVSFNELGRK